jgi:hypothetical protein
LTPLHQGPQVGFVARSEGTEGIGALKKPLFEWRWNPLRQDQQFFLVGVEGVGKAVVKASDG